MVTIPCYKCGSKNEPTQKYCAICDAKLKMPCDNCTKSFCEWRVQREPPTWWMRAQQRTQ